MKQVEHDHTKKGHITLSTMLQLISMKHRLLPLKKKEISGTEIKISLKFVQVLMTAVFIINL